MSRKFEAFVLREISVFTQLKVLREKTFHLQRITSHVSLLGLDAKRHSSHWLSSNQRGHDSTGLNMTELASSLVVKWNTDSDALSDKADIYS